MKLRTSLLVAVALLGYVGFASTWTVRQNEEGVRVRFGRPVGAVAGGLHVTLPYPIERIVPVPTSEVRVVPVGVLLDDESRRMLSRSLSLLVILGGGLVILASNNPMIGDQLTQGVISFLPQAIAGSLILIVATLISSLGLCAVFVVKYGRLLRHGIEEKLSDRVPEGVDRLGLID